MKIKRKQGEVLKEVRKRKKLTQTQFGELLGVRYNTICGWETGTHKIPTNRLNEICKILDIPPSYLLGEESVTIEYPFELLTSKKKIDIKEFMPAGANYILAVVKDSGMKCMQIEKGDLAIIDIDDKQINDNSIYAVALEKEILLRKAKSYKNEIVIVSCNLTQCGIYIYHKSEVDIIGKVIRIIRKL